MNSSKTRSKVFDVKVSSTEVKDIVGSSSVKDVFVSVQIDIKYNDDNDIASTGATIKTDNNYPFYPAFYIKDGKPKYFREITEEEWELACDTAMEKMLADKGRENNDFVK